MGFQTQATVTPFNNQTNESWKKDGFLNFYLPTKNGGRRKLGFIGLKTSKAAESDLIKWLNEDPETNARTLLSHLEIEYNPAEGNDDAGFALG